MTAGKGPAVQRAAAPPPGHATSSHSSNSVSRSYFKHSSGKRINTDALVVDAIRQEYPQLHLTVVPIFTSDLQGWAAAGHAGWAPIDKEQERSRWRAYIPPASRLGGTRGFLGDEILFGKFLLDWNGKEFIVYIVNGRDGTDSWAQIKNQYVLAPSVELTNTLIVEAGIWTNELHDEIWVYEFGWWQKNRELYESVKKASWDDVILDEKMKNGIIDDVTRFFDSRETYEKLKVPWKRGVIYHGPPGNGKTISIKAMMNMLYKRKLPVPTLYVKTLSSFMGPEFSINEIFSMARRTAPCYLVFEDLDSIVRDDVRSFFLNAVDGIAKNDGILMVGSTNHLELLDPGISKRPSRFDRKYLFPNPSEDERTAYMKFWQKKLEDNDDVDFPDKLYRAVAKITEDFSFAYLQEVMVASLLVLARDQDHFSERTCLECMDEHEMPEGRKGCDRETKRSFSGLYRYIQVVRSVDDEDPDLDGNILWREIKKQVRILREEMSNSQRGKTM